MVRIELCLCILKPLKCSADVAYLALAQYCILNHAGFEYWCVGRPGCTQLYGHEGICDSQICRGKRQCTQTARARVSAEQKHLRFSSTCLRAVIPTTPQTGKKRSKQSKSVVQPKSVPRAVVAQRSSQRWCKRKAGDDLVCSEEPRHLRHKGADASDGNCPICLGPLSPNPQQTTTTRCGHLFCRCCLQKWLQQKHSCPLCKTSIGHARSSLPSGGTSAMLRLP